MTVKWIANVISRNADPDCFYSWENNSLTCQIEKCNKHRIVFCIFSLHLLTAARGQTVFLAIIEMLSDNIMIHIVLLHEFTLFLWDSVI